MQKLLYHQYRKKTKVNNTNIFNLKKSISLLKKTATAKFTETVEAHINLNISLKNLNQHLSKSIIFPHKLDKKSIIVVLTTNKQIEEIKEAGADIVADEDFINKLSHSTINFDVLISTSEMIPKLVKFGRLLGPKGLMPSLKSGTLVKNSELVHTIQKFRKGKFEYKIDKTGNIHVGFGKSNFSENQLLDNLKFFI
jgi:large subunit ribosomal protein L1